jgi:four helix bundle protein
VRRFEDLVAWRTARESVRHVYRATQQARCAADFRLASQIQGAAISVMSNIAEGLERDSPAEFQQLLKISKGSCGETRSLLYVAFDNGLIDSPTFERRLGNTDELSRVVAGLRASVIRRRIDAARHRPKR